MIELKIINQVFSNLGVDPKLLLLRNARRNDVLELNASFFNHCRVEIVLSECNFSSTSETFLVCTTGNFEYLAR